MPLVVNATFAVLSNVEAQPGVSTASDGFGMINEPTAGANFFGGFFWQRVVSCTISHKENISASRFSHLAQTTDALAPRAL